MSNGIECTKGVCNEGKCIHRDCAEVADGKNVCKDDKLMLCDDGTLVEDTENACTNDMPLCRDGEFECSTYKDCDTIEHGQNGCKDGNIVVCNDGETSVIDGGNCAESNQLCIADASVDAGFICKTPEPTDCEWNGSLVAKNETICDGNVLKTCSANKDGVLSDGFDCASVNNGKPYCDPKLNICRAYYNCGDNDEIAHNAIACNAKGTNKANIEAANICVCDSVKGWVSDGNTCSCPKNHINMSGVYELKAICAPDLGTYNSTNNTCTCNADKHLVWDDTAKACVCDVSQSYGGTAGSCECSLFRDSVCTPTSDLYIGDIVKFGKYEWIVLSNTSDGVILLTKDAVAKLAFDSDASSTKPWKDADIRNYLGVTFYYDDAEFSEAQKARIQDTVLTDVETTDKVFLLSVDELNIYTGIDGVTDFGATFESNVYWWLRNTHPTEPEFAYIYDYGFHTIATYRKGIQIYIRPVVVIK